MVCEHTISLRVGLYLFPFRIGLERSPILPGLLAARVLQDVYKKVLRIRRVFRTPKANALHVVSPENSVGVIAKPSYQSIHFALVNVIHTQLVDMLRRFRPAKIAETESHRDSTNERQKQP